MWHSNDVLELSYAVVNFKTEEITWKPSGFNPKRRAAILAAISKGVNIYHEDLEKC